MPAATRRDDYRERVNLNDAAAGISTSRQLKIIHTVSSLGIGGMERVVLQLTEAQQRAGHRSCVVALKGGPLEREAARRGLDVHVLAGTRLARGLRAMRVFQRVRPDIVHVHNPTSLHYALLARLVSHAKIVVTVHSDQGTHARVGSALEWRLTSSVVAVSHAASQTLDFPGLAARPAVIHNGIAPPAPSRARDRLRSEFGWSNDVVGIIVARIDGRKGHGVLLDSIRRLIDSNAPVRLLIVGDGSQYPAVERRISELGLGPDIVRMLGRRSDIDALLEAADFFVLPSEVEGLPMSLLEALAHGLPVIASNVGGIPEVITDGVHGLLVPPGDVGALTSAIGRVVADSALRERLSRVARERAAIDFSLDATLAKYQQLYERALQ